MALTPEKIAQFDRITGLTTPAPSDNAARIAELQAIANSGSVEPQNGHGLVSRIGTDFANRGQKVSETISNFQQKNQTGNAGLKDALQSGLNVAGQFAGGALDIVGEGIKSIIPKAAEKGLSKLSDKIAGAVTENPRILSGLNAINAGIDKYDEWKAANPEDAKSLEAVVNIGSLALGTKGDVNIKPNQIANSVSDAAVRGKNMLTSIIEKQKTKAALSADEQAFKDALEVTRPVLNKKESIAAFEKAGAPGGVDVTGKLKTVTLKPDQNALEIADSVKGIVSKKKGPIDNIVSLNEKIGQISQSEVKPFLDSNPVPLNFEDLRNYLPLKIKPSSALRADPEAFGTYRRVTEDITNKIYKTLKEKAQKSGDFGNLTNLNDVWDARKVIDNVIEKELGTATFDSPQYTGVRAAAKDARQAFSDFIVESLSSPGQLEKINKMTDFLNEARKRGIELTEADAVKAIEKQFGITRTSEDEAKAAFFKSKMKTLNHIYEARGNIAEQNYRLLDKNAIQRWIKQNPTKWKALKVGGGVLGVGALGGFVSGD